MLREEARENSYGLNRARLLSLDRLKYLAVKDSSAQIAQGTFTEQQVEGTVVERVLGINLNKTDVIFIDIDHRPTDLDPVVIGYLQSPRTRIIVPEYFYPELYENAKAFGLRTRMEKQMQDPNGTIGVRLSFAKSLADTCAQIDKPVATMDIADKPDYLVSSTLFNYFPAFLPVIAALITRNFEFLSLEFLAQLPTLIESYLRAKGRSVASTESLSKFDRLIPDFVQARRLFFSKGIRTLTELTSQTQSEEDQQIVVLCPKAHNIRMIDLLTNPHPKEDRLRENIFKPFGPTLD